jgi:flagellar protein FliO/FliZ
MLTDPHGPSLLPMVLMLLLVLALIPAALWLLRRAGGAVPGGSGGLRVLAQMSLGQRERLVVVEAGERCLLLAVSGAGIQHLAELERGAFATPAAAGESFPALLRAWRNRSNP